LFGGVHWSQGVPENITFLHSFPICLKLCSFCGSEIGIAKSQLKVSFLFKSELLKDHLDQHQYWDQHIFLGFCDAQLKSSFITIYLIVRIMLPTILIF